MKGTKDSEVGDWILADWTHPRSLRGCMSAQSPGLRPRTLHPAAQWLHLCV